MKYHTIRSEKFNSRCNGSYATYPIYTHDGIKIGNLEGYSSDINKMLEIADNQNGFDGLPFFSSQNI